MSTFSKFIVLTLLGFSPLYAVSQTISVPDTHKGKAEAPMSDQAILTLLHTDNKKEVQWGHDAKMQAMSDEVKLYAKRLEKDDRYADRHVRALAGRLGIKLHDTAEAAQDEKIDDTAFERSFIQAAADGHEELLDTLEHQRTLLPKDSPVYDLVRYLLPTIRNHYETAVALETQVAQRSGTEQVASLISSDPH